MASDHARLPASTSRDRTVARRTVEPSELTNDTSVRTETQRRSLDLVQRTLLSSLVLIVMGSVSAGLVVYLAMAQDHMTRSDIVGLWAMTGVVGVLCFVPIMMINRRKPYHPLVLLGLLPMALAWYWVFGPGA